MNKISKVISSDIIEQIPHKKKAKIPRQVKADVVVDLANGESIRETGKKYGISAQTIQEIKNEHQELIDNIQNKLTNSSIDKKLTIANKYLHLLDLKYNRIEREQDKLDYIKSTELSNTAKDLWTMARTEQGEATSITEYKGKSKDDLLKELKEATIMLEQGDKKALLHAVFKEND